jgi:hypothetical protein
LLGIEGKSVSDIIQPESIASPSGPPSPGLLKAQQAATRRQLAQDTPKELPYIFLAVALLIVLLAVVYSIMTRK